MLSNDNVRSGLCLRHRAAVHRPHWDRCHSSQMTQPGVTSRKKLRKRSNEAQRQIPARSPGGHFWPLSYLNTGSFPAQSVPTFAAVWNLGLLSLHRCATPPLRNPRRRVEQDQSLEPLCSSQAEQWVRSHSRMTGTKSLLSRR